MTQSAAVFKPFATGDINQDGKVDGIDLGTMAAQWLAGSGSADLDSSSAVNFADYSMLAANWMRGLGSLQVTILPQAAIDDGAMWRVDGGAWRTSGQVVSGLTAGSHTVEFSNIGPYKTPANQQVEISEDATSSINVTYMEAGCLYVTISPAQAVSEGAQWRIAGGTWRNSGYTETDLAVGAYTLEFASIPNWVTPDFQLVQITENDTTSAAGFYTAPAAAHLVINEFLASNGSVFGTPSGAGGTTQYPDWIEIYNPTTSSANLSGWYLTDKADNLTKWPFPNISINAGAYLVVFASGQSTNTYQDPNGYYHTNFSLDPDGEYLALVQMVGETPTVVHEYDEYEFAAGTLGYPPQERDMSYGLLNYHNRYFLPPTPGAANIDSYCGLVSDTRFSHDRGFYYNDFYVTIGSETAGRTYTTHLTAASRQRAARLIWGPFMSRLRRACGRGRISTAGCRQTSILRHTSSPIM